MRVFISHKSADMDKAERHARDLKQRGFDVYLDKYDPVIKVTKDRALHIKTEIDKSTDLLVVITEITQESWWVPFEVGLSTASDMRIASIVYKKSANLPSFLRKWPVIDSSGKYAEYLKELEKNKSELIEEMVNFSNESAKVIASTMTKSQMFHKVLMERFEKMS